MAPGSEVYNVFLRCLGVKVGIGATIFATDITGFNLISIGSKTTIAKDVLLSPMGFIPRADKNFLVTYGPIAFSTRASIGESSVILGDIKIAENCLVGPMTFLSNDMSLSDSEKYIYGAPPKPMTRAALSSLGNGDDDVEMLYAPKTLYPQSIIEDCDFPDTLAKKISISTPVDKSILDSNCKEVLVTGSTGFVGRFLVVDLLKAKDVSHVYCICRAKNNTSARARMISAIEGIDPYLGKQAFKKLKVYAGNIAAENFGLKKERYNKLTGIITHVFHSAAQLSYSASYDRLKIGNVYGTLKVMEFCVDGKMKLLNHVSTQGVISPDMIDANGIVTENTKLGDIYSFPSVGGCDQSHGYAISKWVAEVLVQRGAELGIPTRIFRLPQISGHSRSGFVPDNRNDLLCDFIKDSVKFKMVPLLHGTVVNISPVDIVSSIMVQGGLDSKHDGVNGKAKVYHCIVKEYNMETENVLKCLQQFDVKLVKVNDWRDAIIKEYGSSNSTEISAMLWFCSYYQSQNESLDQHMEVGSEVRQAINNYTNKNSDGAVYSTDYHLNTVCRFLQKHNELPLKF